VRCVVFFFGIDKMSDKPAVGLPILAIRVAVARSLIVLFAIIAIMLYQTISKPSVSRREAR
jgi:hypothetical protein